VSGARIGLALALAALLGVCGDARAQGERAGEYKVKAAFLYKFGGYVEWPDGTFAASGAPLTIGVAEADTLADELARVVQGRSVGGRPVAVRKLRPGDSLDGVHVLFIGRGDPGQLDELLQSAHGRPTLTVTESDDALRKGSMINFVVVDDKVRFDVALPPAEERKLRISSRLLAVARRVVVGPR
jgi:hypothetical protein